MKDFLHALATDRKKGFFADLLKLFLLVLSYVYRLGILIRKFLYKAGLLKTHKLSKPVISVGNITWGGVGKTPIVMNIAKDLNQKGLKPVILTRGYMGKEKRTDGDSLSAISDEAQMLRKLLPDVPVLVDADRALAAESYLKDGNEVDVFLLDDGFQHWKLYRDLDIVAIDCLNPFGNRNLIPRGILRETLGSLSRADMIILTKTSQARKEAERLNKHLYQKYPQKTIIQTNHKAIRLRDLISQEQEALTYLRSRDVCCFCGIGNPLSFEREVEALGANVRKCFSFPDHYEYSLKDITNVINYCKNNNINSIITTSKDEIKITDLPLRLSENLRLYVLEIELEIIGRKDQLIERVLRLLCD